jgi:hypothetical protein
MGRPSEYTEEKATAICALLAEGLSLREICKKDGMPPHSTVRQWVLDDRAGFAAHYARARDFGLDALADEILEIANTPKEGIKTVEKPTGTEVTNGDMIEHRRLQVEARKWYLSKLAPKRYGDKLAVEHDVSDALAERLKTARARAHGAE